MLHGGTRARWGAVVGLVALLAMVGTPAQGQPSPTGPTGSSGSGAGQTEQAGPRYGAVDPRYSSPTAAEQTVQDHDMAGMDMAGMPGMSGAGNATPGEAEDPGTPVLDPAVYGSWQRTVYDLPVRAIHATLLRTGKILLIAGSGNQAAVFQAGTFQAGVLDPETGSYKAVNPPYDMFCAGHAQLPNGNILIVGGTVAYPTGDATWKGSSKVFEFDVVHERWITHTSMAHGRWYPSSVEAPSGNIVNFAGNSETGGRNKQVERYTSSSGALSQMPAWSLPKYPGVLWTAKNQVFYSGTRFSGAVGQPGLYNPITGAVQAVAGVTDLDRRDGAATLFAGDVTQQRAMVLGGGFPATDTTAYIDLRPARPVAVPGPHLPTAKGYVGAVNLPTNGSVFETGGGTGRDTPVFESSIIQGSTVMPMAPNTIGRTYHSSTMLLPDGRVLTMGGDDLGPGFEMQVEIFSPPYLHQGTRPAITSAPAKAGYRTSYTVKAAAKGATLSSAWLLKPASTTHSIDPNQRAVRLRSTRVAGGLKVTTPTKYLAPPGYYMLFVNDSLGRPSVARWVKVG